MMSLLSLVLIYVIAVLLGSLFLVWELIVDSIKSTVALFLLFISFSLCIALGDDGISILTFSGRVVIAIIVCRS